MNSRFTPQRNHAFSLIELSIVLVILGLLTGGILAGQSLIRASELRNVSVEYSRFVTATQAFRDKYFALPGDFIDGTRFWGRLNSNADCATSSASVVAAPGTCDGNGNAIIDNPSAANASGEAFQYWRQLTLAGLIEGNYTGLAGSGGLVHSVLGTNVPASKASNAGWFINGAAGTTTGSATVYQMMYGNKYVLGAAITNSTPENIAFKSEEAWNIDTKIDDGKPASGKVIASNWATCTTSATFSDYAGAYQLDNNALGCTLRFRNSF